MSQARQQTNPAQLAQWNAQLRKQVKALVEELNQAWKTACAGSARARDQRLGEVARQVRDWRAAVRPLIGAMRAARDRRRARTSAARARALRELARRVRQVRREAREMLERFDAALRIAASEAKSVRAGEIASIESMVRSLRGQLRQFLAEVRRQRGERSAAEEARGGFVRPPASQRGFVQNVLGLTRRRKSA
jgi:hypothetical protein